MPPRSRCIVRASTSVADVLASILSSPPSINVTVARDVAFVRMCEPAAIVWPTATTAARPAAISVVTVPCAAATRANRRGGRRRDGRTLAHGKEHGGDRRDHRDSASHHTPPPHATRARLGAPLVLHRLAHPRRPIGARSGAGARGANELGNLQVSVRVR